MHGNVVEWVQDCVVFLREFERLFPGDLTNGEKVFVDASTP